MASLTAFLNPERPEEEELIVSDRFKEDGKVVAFKIRPISQEKNKALIKQYTRRVKTADGERRELDRDRYADAFIVAGTAFPDFTSEELCSAYGTLDPLQVPGRMLLAGEYMKLSEAIMRLSGIGTESDAQELDEAKN